MVTASQTFEKNRFPEWQNRHMSQVMTETERRRSRLLLIVIAAAIAMATLAPVAVLAG